MINYTERIALLMQDIIVRTPRLSFINLEEVIVFGRFGRPDAEGAFATCHCMSLPESEPGYYFWRDCSTGEVTRRSEWFVTKSPQVRVGSTVVKYLISFALPRFCDQTLERSRKAEFYPGAAGWVAKLDTIVHELYHIDPDETGIRRFLSADGSHSPGNHGPHYYREVADMVTAYLASGPNPARYDFLADDFCALTARHDEVVATTFRNFPSFPQRYIEAVDLPPVEPAVRTEPIKPSTQPARYTENDLHIRHFTGIGARRLTRKDRSEAA